LCHEIEIADCSSHRSRCSRHRQLVKNSDHCRVVRRPVVICRFDPMQSTIRRREALGPLDDSCECPVDSDGFVGVAVQVRGLVMAPGVRQLMS
jgi:hypothetical protein